MIFLIAILAAFLRFYRIVPNLVFHGELGDNYLAIKDFITSGQIPLLGPATSHPWLSFGPLYYWIMAPVLNMFKYDPVSGTYLIAATQVILVLVNFYFVNKLFSKKAALISSFIISISPLFINLARQSRFYSLVTVLFYPFVYTLITGNLFWCGFIFGAMLNFHLTPIVFVPTIIIYLVKKKIEFKKIGHFLIGLIIPSIPFLIYNFTHGLTMVKNLSLWLPYRVAGFVGVVPKNSPTNITILNNFYTLGGFVSGAFVYRFLFGAIFVIAVFIYIVWQVKKNWKVKKIDNEFLLVLIFIFGYAGIFIHGNPPIHYYLPLYALPIIFVSLVLARIKSREIIIVILAILTILNFKFYFSKEWFNQDTTKIYPNKEVPYSLQLEATTAIYKDADGRKYSLGRVGDYDYFDQNYSQNYKYLLWWKGQAPVDDSKLKYTIYEGQSGMEEGESMIFEKGGITVTKQILK